MVSLKKIFLDSTTRFSISSIKMVAVEPILIAGREVAKAATERSSGSVLFPKVITGIVLCE